MKTEIKVKKSPSFRNFLIIVTLFIIGILYGPILFGREISLQDLSISTLIVLTLIALFASIWFNTKYYIDDSLLKIVSGPFWWKIDILNIKKIWLNQYTIAGVWKPTLSWECMEIKYKKSRSISISPAQEKEFLKILMEINPEIEVKE